MPFGMASGVGRGRGVLSSKGKGQFWDKYGTFHCKQWGLCGLVILCREGCEGWRRGFSELTLGFLKFRFAVL